MNADQLLAHYEQVADAPDAIPRLRRFILDLAVRGKLVEQDPADEPASELLKRVEAEKARLVNAGKIRKKAASDPIMVDAPFDLPRNWAWVSIGTAFLYDAGAKRGPKALDQSLWLLELENIEKDTGRLVLRVRSAEGASQSTKSEFLPGDILYGKLRPYLNKVLVADEPGYSTNEIVAIRPYLPLCSAYCALALRRPDFVKYVTRLGQGTKMPRLRTEDAVVAPFPLPPLAEQHRIAAKVDELMALCDRLEAARAEREATRDRLTAASLVRLNAPDPDPATFRVHAAFALRNLAPLTTRLDQIKALRQTILNLAVRGKLVEQDPTDEPASELLKRIAETQPKKKRAKSVASERGDANNNLGSAIAALGWTKVWLDALSIFENGDRSSNYPSGPDIKSEGIPFFNTKNLSDYRLRFTDLDFITQEKFDSLRSGRLQDLDILITLRGSVGKFGLFKATEHITTGFINAQLLIIRCLELEIVLYIVTFMKSDDFAKQISLLSSGAATPQLSVGKLAEVLITLPPLAEQRRIVAKVDELMALCDRLEESIITGNDACRRLFDALLAEALAPAQAREIKAAE